MGTRLLILKIAATLAALIAGGCTLPPISVKPVPNPDAKTVEHKIVLEVVGEGKVRVDGDAEIAVKGENPAGTAKACPCCGTSGVCRGLCGKAGCLCSRGEASVVPSVGNTVVLPQFTTQTQKVYQCRNGVCGWYDVEVRVPVVPARKRASAAGKVTVYTNCSPACVAMRSALRDVKGIDFEQIPLNGIPGIQYVPTAVKPDGSTWTPAPGPWHSGSLAEFLSWRERDGP